MNKSRIFLIIILLLILFLSALHGRFVLLYPKNIISVIKNDFGGGELTFALRRALFQKNGPPGESYGDYIFAFKKLPDEPFGLYRYAEKIYLEDLKPLKLMSGDVTGDGIPEISVIVYKSTMFDEILDKRPFFYNYTGGELRPLWLGSRLSRRFADYILWDDGSGKIKIAALEYGSEMSIGLYEWDDFGFILLARSEPASITGFGVQDAPGFIAAEVYDDEKNESGLIYFYYDGTEILRGK